ncbi:MAG: Cytochrome [Actinomycetia bacterium]|nr:Cytochrome [Actinomycetes bacterium]
MYGSVVSQNKDTQYSKRRNAGLPDGEHRELMMTETTDVRSRPGFDHATSPELVGASFDGWSRLRAESPAFRSDIAGTYDLWYLLRYADIRAALQDHELFSSRSVQYVGNSPQRLLPEELDPPEHAKYRRLLNAPLSPSAIRAREEQIRTLCVALIEEIAPHGECDFLTGFAQRFPTTIFLDLMGLPAGKAAEFVARAQTVLHVTGEQDPDFSLRAAAAMGIIADIGAAVAARRETPRDDMISRLVNSTVDDRPLTDDELYQLGFLLYLAGLDTVANVLTYSFRFLAGRPDLRSLLRDEPDKIPYAVEELLRLFSIASTVRVVTRDTMFAGCPMKAGDRVVLPTASAGRDGGQYRSPDEFKLDRFANAHLAFGAGPHRCAGAHLARLELRIALEEWHRRIPDYELADDKPVTEYVGAVAGLTALPLRWPPTHGRQPQDGGDRDD